MWGCGGGDCSAYGTPWMYVLRDTLQGAFDLESAVAIIDNATRTWAIDVGISSKVDGELEILQYTHENTVVFAEKNATDPCSSNPNAHPVLPGLLYIDVFGDPACNPCVGNMFLNEYGNITADFLYRNPAPMSQTGDTLLAVYDFTDNYVYVAFS